MYVLGILRYLQHLCALEGATKSFQNFIELQKCMYKQIKKEKWKGQQMSRYWYQQTKKLDMKAKKSLFAPPNLYPLQYKRQRQQYGVVASNLDTIQDFLCKSGIQWINLISIFSLNHVIVRPIKIIKDLCEASTQIVFMYWLYGCPQ